MCEIIAECGVNWQDVSEAKWMIERAKEIGVDYVKFQLFSENEIKNNPLYEELKKRMLTKKEAEELFEYGKAIGQPVFFSCMFEEAVDWVVEIGVPMIKIRYKDRYNFPLIKRILETDKKVIMSMNRDYHLPSLVLRNIDRIDFLWCVDKYPASIADYSFTRTDFKLFSGISDHTKGLEVVEKALSLGAKIIEKHVMLEGTHPLEEKWSITFEELEQFLGGDKIKDK